MVSKKKTCPKFYSQDGEDMVLQAFISKLDIEHGFYVDIGAHHPFRFSNTAYFYNKGWKGINVEPTPTLITDFERFRKKDINLNIGIANEKANLVFYMFDEPALNSFDRELSEYRDKTTNYNIINKINIQTHTLAEVLEQHVPPNQKIDFLTVDVEGLDLEVLKSNNWGKFTPSFILVEHYFNAEKITTDEIYKYLTNLTYELVARTQLTSIFKLKDLKLK